jgi:hypothetical protein
LATAAAAALAPSAKVLTTVCSPPHPHTLFTNHQQRYAKKHNKVAGKE